MKIVAYTDGGVRGNGSKDSIGGWGAYLIFGEHIREFYGSEVGATNQSMELMGCVKALENINTNKYPIEIHTDSAYLCNGMNNKWYVGWRKNGWKNAKKQPVANKELWEKILSLIEGNDLDVTFIKVKGHSGVEGNEKADELCNRAMNEYEKSQLKDNTKESVITHNKLVRDIIPDIIKEDGKSCEIDMVGGKDYVKALKNKLKEEVKEVEQAKDVDSLLQELADVLEVVHALVHTHGSSMQFVEELRLHKRHRCGGFEKGIILKTVKE